MRATQLQQVNDKILFLICRDLLLTVVKISQWHWANTLLVWMKQKPVCINWPICDRPSVTPLTEHSSRLHTLSTRAATQRQTWSQLCVAPTVAEASSINMTCLCLNERWTIELSLAIVCIGRAAKNGACSLPLPTGFTGLQYKKWEKCLFFVMTKWLIEYNDLEEWQYPRLLFVIFLASMWARLVANEVFFGFYDGMQLYSILTSLLMVMQ
jgi:hypothetical protein